MKVIINEKLYDTVTATQVVEYIRNINGPELSWYPGHFYVMRHEIVLYKTPKGSYFEHDTQSNEIRLISNASVKEVLSRLFPDEYIKEFGSVEEA